MSKFTSWLKSDTPAWKYNAGFGGIFLSGFKLKGNLGEGFNTIPTKGLTATVQDGANVGSFISAKRVIAGGILFGPLGAGVGALARKNLNEIHVVIERDGEIIGTISDSAKHLPKARMFAQKLNASAVDPENTGQ